METTNITTEHEQQTFREVVLPRVTRSCTNPTDPPPGELYEYKRWTWCIDSGRLNLPLNYNYVNRLLEGERRCLCWKTQTHVTLILRSTTTLLQVLQLHQHVKNDIPEGQVDIYVREDSVYHQRTVTFFCVDLTTAHKVRDLFAVVAVHYTYPCIVCSLDS